MRVYISHAIEQRRLVEQLTATLTEAGHEVSQVDIVGGDADVVELMSSAVRTADVVVALIASGSPNVYFELGLAAGAGVPTILVGPLSGDAPFDLRSMPFVQTTANAAQDTHEVERRIGDVELRTAAPVLITRSAVERLETASVSADAYEAMNPAEFEDLVARALGELGFRVVKPAGEGHAGFDLALKVEGPTGGLWLVECKKYSQQRAVPAAVVRQLAGMVEMHRANGGLLVSGARFTASAHRIAGVSRVNLVRLTDLLAMTPATVSESTSAGRPRPAAE